MGVPTEATLHYGDRNLTQRTQRVVSGGVLFFFSRCPTGPSRILEYPLQLRPSSLSTLWSPLRPSEGASREGSVLGDPDRVCPTLRVRNLVLRTQEFLQEFFCCPPSYRIRPSSLSPSVTSSVPYFRRSVVRYDPRSVPPEKVGSSDLLTGSVRHFEVQNFVPRTQRFVFRG